MGWGGGAGGGGGRGATSRIPRFLQNESVMGEVLFVEGTGLMRHLGNPPTVGAQLSRVRLPVRFLGFRQVPNTRGAEHPVAQRRGALSRGHFDSLQFAMSRRMLFEGSQKTVAEGVAQTCLAQCPVSMRLLQYTGAEFYPRLQLRPGCHF